MKVLITEARDFSAKAISRMEKAGWQVDSGQYDYGRLLGKIKNYDGIIVRLGIQIDEKMISNAPKLKFIATTTTGLDHIDANAAQERGVLVLSLQGARKFLQTITPTAELAVGLMIALMRKMMPASQSVLRGEWDREKWVGASMRSKTLGIIGLGRLGSITAKLGSAFGCEIIYYDPYVDTKKYRQVKSLGSFAGQADVVSVHVPLNTATAGLIGANYFNHAKRGQIFINTSRGGVVREKDLIVALQAGSVAAAGLDVIADELDGKIKESLIVQYAKKHSNVIITPHLGGAADDEMRKVEKFIVNKIINAQARKTLVKN